MKQYLVAILVVISTWIGPATALAGPPEYVYVTEDVQARRFSDSATPVSGEVKAGTRAQVVYRLEGWVRVRLPGLAGFGWVPVDKTSSEAPEGLEGAAPPEPSRDALTPEQRKSLEDALKNLGR